jgi:hypothetical protein
MGGAKRYPSPGRALLPTFAQRARPVLGINSEFQDAKSVAANLRKWGSQAKGDPFLHVPSSVLQKHP